MAKKSTPRKTRSTPKAAAKSSRKAAPKARATAASSRAPAFALPDPAQFAKLAKVATPEQIIELYKANCKAALDIINATLEGTAKMRKLQYEGEEHARAMQQRTAKSIAGASHPNELMAVGSGYTQEAAQKAMQYWSEMFEVAIDMQKRLFGLMEEQMRGVPGFAQLKAATGMMPELGQAHQVVSAMQALLTQGNSAYAAMTKVVNDMTRTAQQNMRGGKWGQ